MKKEEIIKKIEKYAGKLHGLELIISKNKNDKRFIKGFEEGKKFMKKEILELINKEQ